MPARSIAPFDIPYVAHNDDIINGFPTSMSFYYALISSTIHYTKPLINTFFNTNIK